MTANEIVRAIEQALAEAITAGRTQYEIAKTAGVDHSQLSRFRRGERGLSFESTARLMEALGLGVVEDKKRGKR